MVGMSVEKIDGVSDTGTDVSVGYRVYGILVGGGAVEYTDSVTDTRTETDGVAAGVEVGFAPHADNNKHITAKNIEFGFILKSISMNIKLE